MTSPLPRRSLGALLILALGLPALAHDFWLEPSSFTPAVDGSVVVSLRNGHAWQGDSVPRNNARIVRFDALRGESSQRLPGRDGRAPAAIWRPTEEGLTTLVYQNTPKFLELGGAKFQSYLLEEGLREIHDRRVAEGIAEKSAREHYSRCAKALVLVGDAAGEHAGFDARAGLELEITPLDDPFALRPGDPLRLAVELDGQPLPDVQVSAFGVADSGATHSPQAGPERSSLEKRTDERGLVTLVLPARGRWMIKSTHMVERDGDSVDYESYWASLVFQNSGRPDGEPVEASSKKADG